MSLTSCCLPSFGVPQGSVLGPILFTLYVAPVANVITSYGVCHLQYADNTQLYIALKNEDSISNLQNCANDVYNWFAQNGLSLNPEKSEAILLGTGARLRHEQPISSISIAGSDVGIRDSVKSLGVTIDSGLTFNEHVNYICKTSAYHIRSLRHIRNFIDNDAAMSVALLTHKVISTQQPAYLVALLRRSQPTRTLRPFYTFFSTFFSTFISPNIGQRYTKDDLRESSLLLRGTQDLERTAKNTD